MNEEVPSRGGGVEKNANYLQESEMFKGINVDPSMLVTKYEDIDCKVDSYACEPTEAAAGRLQLGVLGLGGGLLWGALVGGALMAL